METNWAAEQLQTIRTLMERSAMYRRALAPVMIYVGVIGTAAAAYALSRKFEDFSAFVIYWGCTAVVAMVGSFMLVRRQALKDSEPFWSSPTRRVFQAFLPPLAAGFVLGASVLAKVSPKPIDEYENLLNLVYAMVWLPLTWVILYGCAFHSAGFFMPRGMRLFAWVFIIGGSLLFLPSLRFFFNFEKFHNSPAFGPNCIMGFFFGVLHLTYGIYLYFTERKNAA